MQQTGALRAPALAGSAPGACGALTRVLKTRKNRQHMRRRPNTKKSENLPHFSQKKNEKIAMQQIAQKMRYLPSKLRGKKHLKNQDF